MLGFNLTTGTGSAFRTPEPFCTVVVVGGRSSVVVVVVVVVDEFFVNM